MVVLKTGIMEDGTKIQIENWNGGYPSLPYGNVIGSYPVSKNSLQGQFSPKLGKSFRCAFSFQNEEETEIAFNDLLSGGKVLNDFKEYIENKEYVACL